MLSGRSGLCETIQGHGPGRPTGYLPRQTLVPLLSEKQLLWEQARSGNTSSLFSGHGTNTSVWVLYSPQMPIHTVTTSILCSHLQWASET